VTDKYLSIRPQKFRAAHEWFVANNPRFAATHGAHLSAEEILSKYTTTTGGTVLLKGCLVVDKEPSPTESEAADGWSRQFQTFVFLNPSQIVLGR
jgi:hypothetical protein